MPIPTKREVGRGHYEFTFQYKQGEGEDPNNEPQGDLPTIGKLTFEPVNGTQHVTQCLYQTGYANGVNTRPIADSRIVGLHKDGVNGVDIDSPGSLITLEKLFLPGAISGNYIAGLELLRGCVNLYPYTIGWALNSARYQRTYEPDELRFMGATLSVTETPKGLSAWSVQYKWLHANNHRNIEFATGSAPIIVPYIGGHNYIWVFYDKSQINGDIAATIEVPKAVFVSYMYPLANFIQFIGF
jgi:hypothetical protein